MGYPLARTTRPGPVTSPLNTSLSTGLSPSHGRRSSEALWTSGVRSAPAGGELVGVVPSPRPRPLSRPARRRAGDVAGAATAG